MVHSFEGERPEISRAAFIAWNAEISGRVSLGEGASVWYGAVLRGDVAAISVGAGSNVQDGAVLHVDHGIPCVVGDQVTIGHRAVVHACKVGDRCLIGMGAVILNRAVIGEDSIVGAGALVTQGKVFPPRSMILGSPAKALRPLSDEEVSDLPAHAEDYVDLARRTSSGCREM
ncbi:MAG: gamma carbonic anhydrase family protein [Rectinemataceae bacterium]|jgi:carbonic anhydrase/acetyltransferase-like protein (isoleucine patch superfamily)